MSCYILPRITGLLALPVRWSHADKGPFEGLAGLSVPPGVGLKLWQGSIHLLIDPGGAGLVSESLENVLDHPAPRPQVTNLILVS